MVKRTTMQQLVRQRLDGYEQRQYMRVLARKHYNNIMLIRKARREGRLQDIEEAQRWLTERGFEWTKRDALGGVHVIDTIGNTSLFYDPRGKISYTHHRRADLHETIEMWPA
jgi:hypothetical protein